MLPKSVSALVLFVLLAVRTAPAVASTETPPTSGSIRAALLETAPEAQPIGVTEALKTGKRSVPLAFVLSGVVPGAGQVYNRQWIKAAAAVAVEVGLYLGYRNANNKGQEGEDAFQAYAHQYYSPAKYAAWLNDFRSYLIEQRSASFSAGPVTVPEGIDWQHPESWSQAQRTAVNGMFTQLHRIEQEAFFPDTRATFSHRLPYFGEQQYYELIGKYYQFAPGWEDYPVWKEGDTYTEAINPDKKLADGTRPNINGRFLEYAENHAEANDYLRRAQRLTAVILVNHLLAAADAAISAKLHNNRISTDLSFAQTAPGEYAPVVAVRVGL